MQGMSVTLNDIAGMVGVSTNTVSRALRGKSDIGTETRKRVRRAAELVGYRPNGASRALRCQAFHSVGILAGSVDEFYLPEQTLGTMSLALASAGYSCSLVCTSKVDPEHIAQIPLIKARLVDSLISAYVREIPPWMVEAISSTGIPVVWLHRWLEHDSLTLDEADAVDQLMNHLHECGYRSVMFVDYSTGGDGWVAPRRLRAFDMAAELLGMEGTRMAHRRVPRDERFEVTRNWLGKPNRPRAVISGSITGAIAIIQTALHLGLRVPEDLAVAAFDDGRGYYNVGVPAITCVLRPEIRFGEVAAEMAVKKARNPNVPLPSRSVKYTVAIGGSTKVM